MIRHPILRIISQFFYGGYGAQIITDSIINSCKVAREGLNLGRLIERCTEARNYGSRLDHVVHANGHSTFINCTCIFIAESNAIYNTKQNETVWLNWINPNAVGFLDLYMDNYYVKRLVGGDIGKVKPKKTYYNNVNKDLLLDLWSNNSLPLDIINNFYNISNINNKNNTKAGTENYNALSDIFGGTCRDVQFHNATKSMLKSAMTLLDNYFHILLLELFNTNEAHIMLNKLLGGKAISKNYFNKADSNSGVLSRINGIVHYNDLNKLLNITEYALNYMPLHILNILNEQNALDIELFAHAIKVYQKQLQDMKIIDN